MAPNLWLQGGRIERGTALTSYAQDNCGVTARLRAPGVEEGKEEVVRATWICGCDGTRSPVRTGAGIKFVGATYKELVRMGRKRMAANDVCCWGRTCKVACCLPCTLSSLARARPLLLGVRLQGCMLPLHPPCDLLHCNPVH